jgi:carboxyl-terminal processing protease
MPRIAVRRPRGFIALAGLAALTAVFAAAQAEAPKPNELQQLTARVVAMLLERGHMSKPQIDDAVAQRWARNYIESLDPYKYNFLKADVDEFLADASRLDDLVKKGEISWATEVFDRYLKRAD